MSRQSSTANARAVAKKRAARARPSPAASTVVEPRRTGEAPECIRSAVAILGDKWTPLLIHAMAEGTVRFCQLQAAVGGVNPRTLSARLAFLEAQRIVTKTTLSTMPPHTEYRLTPKGADLLPIVTAMAAWSDRHGESSAR